MTTKVIIDIVEYDEVEQPRMASDISIDKCIKCDFWEELNGCELNLRKDTPSCIAKSRPDKRDVYFVRADNKLSTQGETHENQDCNV